MGPAQSEQKNSHRVEGGGGFYGQPGLPHFHVNRPKIVGTAQSEQKNSDGVEGGGGFDGQPGSLTSV